MMRKEMTEIFVCFALLFFAAHAFAAPAPEMLRNRTDGDMMVTQEETLEEPELSVSPDSRNVLENAVTTTFSVHNNGTGTMPWTAVVISDSIWLQIQSGTSGSNDGTITCEFATNTDPSARTGKIRVTAPGATGSPKDVTVTQAGSTQPVLSVSPDNQSVAKVAGTATFSVSKKGAGTMPWTAAISDGSWLSISSGTSGTDTGTITCSFTANISPSARTGTIRVSATGATGNPKDVTVRQAGTLEEPVLSVIPPNRDVAKYAGTATFSISNHSLSGTGTMP